MDIKTYFYSIPAKEREALAHRCSTSAAHIRNIAYGKSCGEKLAVAIEQNTSGAVTRRDLRPDDWHLIWPELVNAEFPAPQQKAA